MGTFEERKQAMNYEMNDFQTDVLDRSLQMPVLVDFWAEWCAPCRQLGPLLENIAEQYHDQLALVKVDTEQHPEIAGYFGIRSIPNVKLFHEGQVVDEFSGALPEQAILQWLQQAIPNMGPQENPVDHARMLLAAQRISEAQQVLSQILKADPENQEAKVLLAQIEIYSEDPAEQQNALELVKGIDPESNFFQVAESIQLFGKLFHADYQKNLPESRVKSIFLEGIHQLRRGHFDKALEELIEVMRQERAYDEEAARKTCIAIFKYLGEGHEISKTYRPVFSRTLHA